MKPRVHIQYALEYPRAKKYLGNLNLLLDSIPVKNPDQLLTSKLFAVHPHKVSTSHSVTRIKYMRAQTSERNRRQQEKDEFRSTVMSSMRKTFSSRIGQSAELRKVIPRRFPRSMSTQLRVPLQSHAYNSVKLVPGVSTFREMDQQDYMHEMQVSPQQNTHQSNKTRTTSKFHSRKEYLRKGSSINKQIVVNLLKIKLTREREEKELPRKDFKNQEIMKMIKLYKGGTQNQSHFPERNDIIKNDLRKPQSRLAHISGWDSEHAEEFYQ